MYVCWWDRMAKYLHSPCEDAGPGEQNGNKQPVILVKFENGILKTSKKRLEFTCYKNTMNNRTSVPKRILVAKSDRICYAGSNFESEMSKITSSVLKVCVVNKKDSTVKLYDADFFQLTPQLKCPDVNIKEEKSYMEKALDLTYAFGSKTQQKAMNSKKKYTTNQASQSVDNSLTAISETSIAVNSIDSPNENNTSSVIPPQNGSAMNVDEVYNLYDIICMEELDALTKEASVFLSAKPETIQLWKAESKYSAFIVQFMENNILSMNSHKAKLLCYLHYMFCFLRTGYAEWKKKEPVHDVPQPFKKKLMDSFTVNRSMPLRLKDKLLAYTMVLGLKLNNFVLNCNLFASSTKISMTRMTAVAHALGCHISGNKSTGMKIIELKLPLYKFPVGSRKGKFK